ncbi:flavodoxin-dependent (E)-4-hydroxy-3-methylbut-2-enyl-diphosphate synthase [Anaerobranca gottschalkii]|uniref:4-hydroxy-3-methylbut-2-en-1-yl diphosphate synthase (flavodoxin) n=1 Tax=Anaerobranca gottschalkii DSM 13577 TaxID=1120990 RepID=A0A1H9ZB76_9FIRM|nr:flavodoxin-dependent (E)-4-hydroxy-3-methylbut-2-enyl-diphosphate synthase [Anaerobranca gottschalkii]SES78872.1 4-hydroxy-3-methylbut-2-en-1-yl diphosphate synthase [Anaerobranca gottschalkii DSM 13577]
MINRKRTREISIGNVKIGNFNPIVIQSMTNTKTENIADTVEQIKRLEDAGCQIVRVAVPNLQAAKSIEEIKKKTNIPLVADIHFDYRLALMAMENGIDKVRINPGNIGSEDNILKVVQEAKRRKIPIRIGINSGSLPKDILEKYGRPSPEAMVEGALREIKLLEKHSFEDICVSLKSSDVLDTVQAYTLLSEKVDYPLHIGITEAGLKKVGAIKSSVGLGILLFNGIGDTIRVSLTGDPIEEVAVAYNILRALKLPTLWERPEIISCPTCGRCDVNLEALAKEVEKRVANLRKPIKIAVMGCVVNGPGEAKEADYGLAGGKGKTIIFKKGEVIRTVPEEEAINTLLQIINFD